LTETVIMNMKLCLVLFYLDRHDCKRRCETVVVETGSNEELGRCSHRGGEVGEDFATHHCRFGVKDSREQVY